MATLPSEIVKTLKQNFKHPEENVHSESKVRIRTECHYKPDRSKKYWKNKYHRHLRQRCCGFYTPAHIPYETVGDVVLDLKDLVDGSLKCLKTKETVAWKKLRAKPKDKLSKRRETIRFENKDVEEAPKTVQKSKKEKEKLANETRSTGGLDDIRQNLKVHRKRVTSVRAGKPYFECVREESAQRAMVLLMQQKSKPDRCISPTRLRHFVSKLRERRDTKAQGDDTLNVLSRETSHENIMNQRTSKERNTRNFTAKLNSLYQLLCSLYNLRTKDLRTKNPLSKDFIKTLHASIPLDQRGRLIRTARHTANQQSLSRAAYYHHSSMTETDHFPVGSPHMFARPSCMYDSASSIFKGAIPADVPNGSGNILQRKFGRAKEGVPKLVEMTWEELLEGKSPNLQSTAPQESAPRNAPGRSSFLQAVRHFKTTRRTGILHHLPQNSSSSQQSENLTMWQQVASSEKHAAKADARSPGITTQQRRRRTPINTVADIIGEDFVQIRMRKAQNVKDKLNQCRVRERKIFTQKMKTVCSAWMYEKDIKAMRQAGIAVHKDFEDDNVKPAEWYNELTKEAEMLTLSSNHEIKKLLGQFYPFAIDDVYTVSFIKAKLCLIIQSLPLYELCGIPIQEALHFLMTHILDASQNVLSDWMGHRKLVPLPPDQKQNNRL